ncbi:MAG: D-alanyl-D-alanine carboxypeptidase/D-alanyl-D-alanine-endopeptidase [Nitrospinota bacterium]|nr:D-alanyl-D-alanine carboxypeptidase/D-alanyl-D-alanine-endopeptidase [Nitrospinota bacterium]MDH5677170.1 D-alanyl-D-alanine carboxypeptidase/D-alanyl-D-alanine-endopeptidase [Nitrospinota bacterium]
MTFLFQSLSSPMARAFRARAARAPLAGLIALLVWATPAFPSDINSQEKFQDSVARVIKGSCARTDNFAGNVISMDTGEISFQMNQQMPMVPASIQKLVVSSAALHHLGPAFRFRTLISHSGTRSNGAVHGDLYVKGMGDPNLIPEQVWIITETIRSMGVARVEGKLIIDQSYFDGAKAAPSWDAKRSQRAYDAGLSALSVNYNTFAVRVFPGAASNDPLAISLLPDPGYYRIVNKGITGYPRRKVEANRTDQGAEEVIHVSGRMAPGDREKTIYINVKDPVRLAGQVFLRYFAQSGVEIAGGWAEGTTPENAKLLYEHKSEPLALIVRGLNKYSNNFIAEQIAKTMAAQLEGPPGDHASALKILVRFLEDSGIPMNGVSLTDASGLSRSNRLTASAVARLLFKMGNRFDIGPDLMAALGIMGVDGSLKTRGNGYAINYAARAKTGSLNGVASLAGYGAGPDGRLHAFTFIINDPRCSPVQASETLDHLVAAIRQWAP